MNQSKNLGWSPDSWRSFEAKQQPSYDDQSAFENALKRIEDYPPLVFAGEIEGLKKQLIDAGRGKSFLLQGGDCAESFADCNAATITRKLKIMLQMSVVLCYGTRKPVVRVGRIAGQYAKPRSQNTEVVDGLELPVFRGENINSFEATVEARKASPSRLVTAYHKSALTLNYIRALTKGGFADLHYPDHWDLHFMKRSSEKERYLKIVANIRDAISFMESLGSHEEKLGSVDFFTSHEGLLLPFEESQTSFVEELGGYYNLGAHMLWIGDRTRQLDGAHIEYFRGIQNPIGLKVGPNATPEDIIAVVKALNPDNAEGRITLITRFGSKQVNSFLGRYIDAVKQNSLNVVWSVDPMHGNAIRTAGGAKTRNFDDILSELQDTSRIHGAYGSNLGGVHFELTGDDVTECIGGSSGVTVEDLSQNYNSYCDPRLNYSQSLEMAFLISAILSANSEAASC